MSNSLLLNTASRKEIANLLTEKLDADINAIQNADATYDKRMRQIEIDAHKKAIESLGIGKELDQLEKADKKRKIIEAEIGLLNKAITKKMPLKENQTRYGGLQRKDVETAVHEAYAFKCNQAKSKDKTVKAIAKLRSDTNRKLQLLQTCKTEQDLFDKKVLEKK